MSAAGAAAGLHLVTIQNSKKSIYMFAPEGGVRYIS